MLAAACAVGVACTFAAPIGGRNVLETKELPKLIILIALPFSYIFFVHT